MIDRAGHYETLTRLVDGAQQIEIGADDSPYALNPWDVAGRGEGLAGEDRVPAGAARGDDGRTGRAADRDDRRRDPRRVRQGGQAPRHAAARVDAPGGAARTGAGGTGADAVDVAATLRNLADRLSEYCGEGTYAYLLDRETTVPSDARLVVFDTRRCPDSELRSVMFSIMEYITTTVERHWKAHKEAASRPGAPLFQGRSIMLIDEAWHLISRPETGEYANNLARRARHLGLVLIVMSQQLSDFDTDYGVALLGNCSQQLLLSQNPKEVPFIAETLQLSEREAAELARLKTVKGRHAQMLWLNGTRGRGKVALRVGPTEYWAFTSDPTEVAMREAEIAARRQRVGGDQRRSRNEARARTATRGPGRRRSPAPWLEASPKQSRDERQQPRGARIRQQQRGAGASRAAPGRG